MPRASASRTAERFENKPFEEIGYDMSAIRAAIAVGDEENAQSVMRQFMVENEEGPAPPAGCGRVRWQERISQLPDRFSS